MFKEINTIKVIIMDKRKIRYFGGWIINILFIILILYFQNFATAQLDYSVDLSENARIKSEDKDFLQQRQIEAEKKQIKKKMKELLGDRDYKQLLESCERLQKLDPDDKFIDLYKKFAEEGLLKDSVKPQIKPSVEKVIIETTPEAIESPKEESEGYIGKEKDESKLITKVESKKPMFRGNKKLIVMGITGVVVLVGLALIMRVTKKKVQKVREKTPGDELPLTKSSLDVLSDISKEGILNSSDLYLPQIETYIALTQVEARKDAGEEQKTGVYTPSMKETERKLPAEGEFKLPSFDEVLAEENIGIPESVKREEPSVSQKVDKSPGFDEGLSEPLTSLTDQLAYESQGPLLEPTPPEIVSSAYNEPPVEVETPFPISEEKGVGSVAKEEKSQPQKLDESLPQLDEILSVDITPNEGLVSLPKESLSEIKKEADRKIRRAGEILGSEKGEDAKTGPISAPTFKTGSFDALSIDELLSGVAKDESEKKKVDDFSQVETFSPEKEKERKKSEDLSGADTLVLASDTNLREEKDDWVLVEQAADKISPLEGVKIEEKPISELSKKSEKDIEESVMSYKEDEDELNIESEILSSPDLSAKETKEEKKIESDTDAVFNEHYILGCKAMAERNWKKAIYEFNIALAIKPDSPETKEKLNEARRMKTEEANAL